MFFRNHNLFSYMIKLHLLLFVPNPLRNGLVCLLKFFIARMYFQILKTVKKFFNLSLSLLKVVYEKIYGNTLSTTKKIEIGKF